MTNKQLLLASIFAMTLAGGGYLYYLESRSECVERETWVSKDGHPVVTACARWENKP